MPTSPPVFFQMRQPLENFIFTDLTIAHSWDDNRHRKTSDTLTLLPSPRALGEKITVLREDLLRVNQAHSDFKFNCSADSGSPLRIKHSIVHSGEAMFLYRRYNTKKNALASLGFASWIAKRLRSPLLKEARMVISGETGLNKTTTPASFGSKGLSLFGAIFTEWKR